MGIAGTINVMQVMAEAKTSAWKRERERADAEAFRKRLWRWWLRYEESWVLREYWQASDKRAVVERYRAVFDRIQANKREAQRLYWEERRINETWKRTGKLMY